MVTPRMTSAAMELLPVVCLCLLTCSGTTFSDGTGPSVIRVFVEEGSDAVLPCSLSTKKNIVQLLFARSKLKHGNASIVIRNTKVEDRGNYTCDFPRLQPERQIFYVELDVGGRLMDRTKENITGAAPKPYVTILDQTKDWALLQCEVQGAFPKPEVEWWDSAGNILPSQEPQVSERGGRFYVSLQTTVTKTDHFRCVATQDNIRHQTYTETFVLMNGEASEPSVTVLDETKDWALLQCEVQGASPKPEVVWKDSAGNILPAEEPQVTDRGGSYDIILQTTVTRTDYYRCVATQEEIHHEVYTEIYVYISGFPTGWVVAAVLSAVLVGGVVLLAVLMAKGKLKCVEGLES